MLRICVFVTCMSLKTYVFMWDINNFYYSHSLYIFTVSTLNNLNYLIIYFYDSNFHRQPIIFNLGYTKTTNNILQASIHMDMFDA